MIDVANKLAFMVAHHAGASRLVTHAHKEVSRESLWGFERKNVLIDSCSESYIRAFPCFEVGGEMVEQHDVPDGAIHLAPSLQMKHLAQGIPHGVRFGEPSPGVTSEVELPSILEHEDTVA